jgi:hypothetical protein
MNQYLVEINSLFDKIRVLPMPTKVVYCEILLRLGNLIVKSEDHNSEFFEKELRNLTYAINADITKEIVRKR